MNVRSSVLLLHISPASVWQLQSRVPLRSLWGLWWAAGWRVVSSFFSSIKWKSSRIIWEWIVTKLRQSTAMINISWLHFVRFFVATFCLLVWFNISLSWRRWVGSATNTFDPNTCFHCSKQGCFCGHRYRKITCAGPQTHLDAPEGSDVSHSLRLPSPVFWWQTVKSLLSLNVKLCGWMFLAELHSGSRSWLLSFSWCPQSFSDVLWSCWVQLTERGEFVSGWDTLSLIYVRLLTGVIKCDLS